MSITSAEPVSKSWMSTIQQNRYGALWLILAIVASIPIFWSGFVSLGDAWLTPEYSHGPIIPLRSSRS